MAKSLVLALLLLALPAAAAAQDVTVSQSREADGTFTLAHETVVEASAADVWAAISTAEGWRTWAVPVAWMTGDTLETSYARGASPGDPSTIRQQMIAILPGRTLVFRTTKAPAGFPHFEDFRRVTQFFEVEPAGERRARVRLTGAGYADTEAGRQILGFFREGNRVSLDRLRRRFSAGPIDWSRER